MKTQGTLRKISSFTIWTVIAAVGVFIAFTLSRYAIAVRGILGFSVCYILARLYLFPFSVQKRSDFDFPKGIIDVISFLILIVVISMAFQQVVYTVLWLIKLFQ